MKLITKQNEQINGADLLIKVYRNAEYNEYVNRLFIDGVELIDSSYHTDDKQDALDSMEALFSWYKNQLNNPQEALNELLA